MLGFLYLSLPFLIPIVVFFSLCIIGAIGVAVCRYVAYRFFGKKIPAIWYGIVSHLYCHYLCLLYCDYATHKRKCLIVL